MALDGAATAPLLASCSDSAKQRRNLYPFACAMLASMSTVLMGYNLAVMSGAEIFIREDLGLSDAQTEVLAGSMNVYMLVSIVAAGRAADLVGRRGALVLANAFFLAGALGMSLMAAPFVTGVGVGFAIVVAPVYTAEVSPSSTRGSLQSLIDIFISVGILLGYLSNLRLLRPGLERAPAGARRRERGARDAGVAARGGSPCLGATPTRTQSSYAPRTSQPRPTSVSRRSCTPSPRRRRDRVDGRRARRGRGGKASRRRAVARCWATTTSVRGRRSVGASCGKGFDGDFPMKKIPAIFTGSVR